MKEGIEREREREGGERARGGVGSIQKCKRQKKTNNKTNRKINRQKKKKDVEKEYKETEEEKEKRRKRVRNKYYNDVDVRSPTVAEVCLYIKHDS